MVDQEPSRLADWFFHRATILEKTATQCPEQADNYRKLAERFRLLGMLAENSADA